MTTKPEKGRYYIETGKPFRLYCHGVTDGHVDLSYGPDSPIAVVPTLEDFRVFFEPAPLINIGDVAVCKGEPPRGNPYLGSLMGPERRAALWMFRRDGSAEGYTFWYAPCSGGAQRLYDATQVEWGDWMGSRRA